MAAIFAEAARDAGLVEDTDCAMGLEVTLSVEAGAFAAATAFFPFSGDACRVGERFAAKTADRTNKDRDARISGLFTETPFCEPILWQRARPPRGSRKVALSILKYAEREKYFETVNMSSRNPSRGAAIQRFGHRAALALIGVLAGGCAASQPLSGQKMATDDTHQTEARARRTVTGLWGAKGIGLTISAQGDARMELDCSHGTIASPLSVAADGTFEWTGTYAVESPGPARSTDREPAARYRGSIDGDRMTVTIESTSPERALGPFVLTLGAMPRIRKCS
ncbi:MAG: hypothetical protein ABI914_06420 [Acidobacteriota bacterium]